MKLLSYLEKNNILTREILGVYGAVLLIYFASLYFFNVRLAWWGFSFSLIALGGLANLYVMDFNNCRMPVLISDKKEFKKRLKRNPGRRFCMINYRTKLRYLADRFYIGKRIFSIGDFIISLGIILAIIPFVLIVVAMISKKIS